MIAGGPGAVARWRQVASRSIAAAGLAVTAELLDAVAALSLVGPRAARIARAAGLPDELGVGTVGEGTLAGSPVTLIREDGDHLLLLFEQGHPERRLAGALGRRPRARPRAGGQRGARAAARRAPLAERLGQHLLGR